MGMGKRPKIVKQEAPPEIDESAIDNAAEAEAQRSARRRGSADTMLSGFQRRLGGLAGAMRKMVGGG